MGGDRLKKNMERLHKMESSNDHRESLAAELLPRFRSLHPRNRSWLSMFNPWNRAIRLTYIGLAMLILGVGACSTKTTTEVEVGKQLSISFSEISLADGSPEHTTDLQQCLERIHFLLGVTPGVEVFNINLRNDGSGDSILDIILFGRDLDGEELANRVRKSVPVLAEAPIAISDLGGTITESWAQRLGRQVFNIKIGDSTEEEIRVQVLQQLQEQGFSGSAEVNTVKDGNKQMIEIKVNGDEGIEQ